MPVASQLICCPYCKVRLTSDGNTSGCVGCHKEFPVLLGIPDLRISVNAWIDFEEDRALAISLSERYETETFESLLEKLWASRQAVPLDIVRRRILEINRAEAKCAEHLSPSGWIGSLLGNVVGGCCAELGCGPGGFLAKGAQRFDLLVGVDISLAWLVLAKKRLEERGLTCPLVCGCVECLPLQSGKFDLVVALDTVEHVTDRRRMLEEIQRVTRPGGKVACTTPNRFSVSAEPHVGVWGVGFLPRRWMPAYVRWRNGMTYRHTYPLSLFDLRRLCKSRVEFDWDVRSPSIWEGDLDGFRPIKRTLARLYNRAIRIRPLQCLLLVVAPFFQIVARKR